MKVFYVQVMTDKFEPQVEEKTYYFEKKSKAKKLLCELADIDPEAYSNNVYFQVMEIVVDRETIMNMLKGYGYADSVLDLDKPYC